MTSFKPIISQRHPLQMPSHWGFGLQHMNLGRKQSNPQQSHYEVLGVRTKTQEFWGLYNSTHNSWRSFPTEIRKKKMFSPALTQSLNTEYNTECFTSCHQNLWEVLPTSNQPVLQQILARCPVSPSVSGHYLTGDSIRSCRLSAQSHKTAST